MLNHFETFYTLNCLVSDTPNNQASIEGNVRCGPLPAVENGRISTGGFFVGAVRTILCNTGFHINGSASIYCLQTGYWSLLHGRCQREQRCGNVPIIRNGRIVSVSDTVGSLGRLNCNSGYHINGMSSITCLADGTWSAPGFCIMGI